MNFKKASKVLNTFLFSSVEEREVARRKIDKAWKKHGWEFDTKIRMLIDLSGIKIDERVRSEDYHYFKYIEKLNK